ncbi:probable LRR receptor-like serine/threonine-protein kinase At3g47570 isoform X1 [Hordeum vulgare subsp. vulgare]|uniref:Receptor kinase-like protein Xa21 n=1 Tax=Hordeum vulgare subsp. vulgare TaxID=112509 RepID=A0A8I7BJJ6_HORVV|nr:probable LRR receptor-like serine/threonine-protein kinase At3g47570 isoform X1 [Hordeum vulgare subsp. vulgare]
MHAYGYRLAQLSSTQMAPVPVGTLSSSLFRVTILLTFLTSFAPASSLDGTTLDDQSGKDFQALLCLKNHLSNNNKALASWNNTLQYCSWPGVTCGKKHASRVTVLDLESLSLNGQIPPCIGNLTFLAKIYLQENLLNGGIPPEVGHLRHLVELYLPYNNLTGVIPNSLSNCSSLQIIDLESNSLHGSIPDGLGLLPDLSVLSVPGNKLTGNIPYTLGSSSSLNYVYLANNSLTGGIPSLLANSSSTIWLNLESNYLDGEVPPSLFNSSFLEVLNLKGNNFFGSIPPFSTNSMLQTLFLSYNNLSGKIPSSLGNSTSLIELLLAANHLQGSLPWSLSKIPNLQMLDLTNNNLSGTVPGSLFNISTLTYLGMGTNSLTGDIPENIGHTLPRIQTFIVQGNRFGGRIPTTMAKARNLQKINLGDNAFHGIIPYFGSLPNLIELNLCKNQLEAGDWTFLHSLASCTKLVSLRLDENNLQGELPKSIGDLPKSLESLYLSANKISGTIPHEIGNISSLKLLYMEHNLLTGTIPGSLGNLSNLFVLSLSQNKLSGQIPLSIQNLGQLSELYLQQNNLSRPIPVALAQCNKLHTLNLSCNSFDGTIPKELFTISTLAEGLDLSHNKLSGHIPMEIGKLINLSPLDISNNLLTGEIPSTLGQCLHLESLHLEGNLLDGRIPQSFAALKGISDMDLSRNNLSGQVPDFFEAFNSMSLLNLSFNNLEGPMPTGGIFQNASKVFVQGNKELCAVSPLLRLPLCHTAASQQGHRFHILKIIGLSALALVMLSCFGVIFLKKGKKVKQEDHPSFEELKKFTYADLVKATNGFSLANLVGSGKYGSVYKGKIESEEHAVAIKVFKLDQPGATKSFVAECQALKNTRHRNLVRVITVCSTSDLTGHEFKALVLEYMVNGNLESWLHPTLHEHHLERPLSLSSRIAIVVDIAAALDYLHNHCMPPMTHCDLKPSNVLLDDVMGACVGDFGLTKFVHSYTSSRIDGSTSLVGPRGSVGYIAPEYGFGSKISTEGDVYSYGVIILEMLTGKRPTDEMFKDGLSLYNFVEKSFPEKIGEILDPRIIPYYADQDEEAGRAVDQENHHQMAGMSCIIKLVKIGLMCAAETPKYRPSMQDVYIEITAIKEAFSALQG